MTLKSRIENLEQGCQTDEKVVEVKGCRFFLNGEKELTEAELLSLAPKVKLVRLGGYLDNAGAEILERIDVGYLSGNLKRYVGISPNDWEVAR